VSDEALGHVSVLIICAANQDTAAAIAAVRTLLGERCLITTRPHVVEPARLPVAVNLTLRIHPDQLKDIVKQRALAALDAFFDPLSGGPDRHGWPFGAAVYRSDVYALMDQVEGVDYVDLTTLTDDVFVVGAAAGNRKITSGPSYVGVRLNANELVAFSAEKSTIDCRQPKTNIPG